MSLTDMSDTDDTSESTSDSSESSSDCLIVDEVVEPKPVKPRKSTPNVLEFKTHFIPGKSFDPNIDTNNCQTYVRRRDVYLNERQSQDSLDGYDSDDSQQTIIDETYNTNYWRNGPAKLWYDRLGLPSDCEECDYGFKLVEDVGNHRSKNNTPIDNEDSFNLVSQLQWEQSVIWDPDSIRPKVLKSLAKPSMAGWIPQEGRREAPPFFKQTVEKVVLNDINSNQVFSLSNKDSKCDNRSVEKTPINGKTFRKRKASDKESESTPIKKTPTKVLKEDHIVKWVTTLPEENRELVSYVWEDDVIWDSQAMTRIPEPKMVTFNDDENATVVDFSQLSDDDSNDSNEYLFINSLRHLSLNISNDEFYSTVTKATSTGVHEILISHSIPAQNLHHLCFPSWDPDYFRPLLKKSRYLRPKVGYGVILCPNQIRSTSPENEETISRDMSRFMIKNICELTARTGQLVLMEYSEESPPLQMRVGMGSQLINYYNKTKVKNYCPERHRFAQTKPVTESPFIGDIGSGKSQLGLETNMFRSPVWEHTSPDTDFLIIKTEDNFYIREIDGLFVVGQQLPLMEVPGPKSKNYRNLTKQLIKLFINQCFEERKFIKNLDQLLQNGFPHMSHNRKALLCSILNELTIKQSDRFSLKSDVPFHSLLTPEDICAYYSTAITTATTLKQMGVGDRLYLNDDEKERNKIDELFFAPWNTSVAYIGTLNANKWLNVCDYGEDGCLIFRNTSYKEFKDQMPSIKKCIPLSDISIKRLTLDRAHQWLLNYGVSRQNVKKYRNINECRKLIKELSQDLKDSGVTIGMSRTRTTKQYYQLQCQKIFDLHSRYYSNQKSNDDNNNNDESDKSEEEMEQSESDYEYDSDLEMMGQDMESFLIGNKTMEQIQYEREEKERIELKQSIYGRTVPNKEQNQIKRSFKGKVLKITRFYEMNGKQFWRQEIVRTPKVIEAYVRIRETKSDDFIRQLSFHKNHAETGLSSVKKSKTKTINCVNKSLDKPKKVNGILKTVQQNISNIQNGSQNDDNLIEYQNIDITDDNWELNESSVENESLVRVDGSKLKFSKQVVIEANEIEAEEQKRIQLEKEEEERSIRVEYFTPRTTNRRRIDPMVKLKDAFDSVIVEVRKRQEFDENIEWFNEPIREKEVPDYYDIIKNPMDLKTIRNNISRGKYSSRVELLKDIHLIYDNCLEYNGDESQITKDAETLYKACKEKLDSMEDCLAPMEQMLQPNGIVP